MLPGPLVCWFVKLFIVFLGERAPLGLLDVKDKIKVKVKVKVKITARKLDLVLNSNNKNGTTAKNKLPSVPTILLAASLQATPEF